MRSSLAASSVKVTAAIVLGAMPSASISAMRPAMTAVLPEPAPASTRIERSWTADRVRRAPSSASAFERCVHHWASQTCAAFAEPLGGGRQSCVCNRWRRRWPAMRRRGRHMSRRCRPRAAPSPARRLVVRGAQIAGDFRKVPSGSSSRRSICIARIEERGADGDIIAEQRLHGEGVEAALQLLAAVEHDACPWAVGPSCSRAQERGCRRRRCRADRCSRRCGSRCREFRPARWRPRAASASDLGSDAAERHLAEGAGARQVLVAKGERSPANSARVVERAPPDDARRHSAFAFPDFGNLAGGAIDGAARSVALSAAASPPLASSVAKRAIEGHVNEIAHRQRIEDERVVAAFGRAPAQAVDARRSRADCAAELAKRACRLGAGQDGAELPDGRRGRGRHAA